jgi:hypothetical protein
MKADQVIVILDRTEVGWLINEAAGSHAYDLTDSENALQAALDRDRNELADAVAKALYEQPWTDRGGFPETPWDRIGAEREVMMAQARAALRAIEGADQEEGNDE